MPEFLVPATTDLAELERQFTERLGLEVDSPAGPASLERTYYDTFDGRLYRAGWTLVATRDAADTLLQCLPRYERDGPSPSSAWVRSVPRFVHDLPPGRLRAQLEDIVEMRALLVQAELQTQVRSLAMRDAQQKTVARLALERHRLRVDDHLDLLDARVRVESLRGYAKAHRRIVSALGRDWGFAPQEDDLLTASLQRLGRRLDGYSSKIDLVLEPTERADAATKRILRSLLDTMEANVDGMCTDVDSEFLHDFRVSIRRTRSALTRIRRIFPQQRVERFKREFRWLGQLTGPARDMDVYLLEFESMKQRLPVQLRAGLEPLRALLCSRKQEEYRRLVEAVTSRRATRLLSDWRSFVEADVPRRSSLPNAGRPVGEIAREEIWRSHRKVLRLGRAIDDEAPAAQLHELRKACKALRYLMEFFRSLFASEEIASQIAELKALQKILGSVQDLEVQSAAIVPWGRELNDQTHVGSDTLLAVGALGQQLQARQWAVRQQFASAFRRFSHKKNRNRARALFAASAQERSS